MVRKVGLEPTRYSISLDFKSNAFADFATLASIFLVDAEGIEPTRLLREGIYSPRRLLNGLRADINSFLGYKETINLNFTQSTQRPFSLYIKQAF